MIQNIIKFITDVIQLILLPFDLLIQTFLPDLSNAFTAVGELFNIIGDNISFIVSLTGLSSATLSLIVSYYVFKLTVPVLFYGIKLIINWFNMIRS